MRGGLTRGAVAALLVRVMEGATPGEAARRLLDGGLVDLRACERELIRAEVAELVGRGMGRIRAMDEAADRFCCSYEKVRHIIYDKENL